MAPASRLAITGLSEYGYGLGQKGGQTISVARTAPGDQVLIEEPRSKDRWTSAALVRVVQPGPERVAPDCAAFDQGCAGCQWLHLSYQAQQAWKSKNVTALLRTRAGFRGPVHPLRALEHPEAYRNKLSLKVQAGRFVFVPETDGATVAPVRCRVQTPSLQAAWAQLRTLKVPSSIEQLHLRSNANGELGVHAFVRDSSAAVDKELNTVCQALSGVVGIGATSRSGYRIVAGAPYLEQEWNSLRWQVPHNGFFQTNALQAPVLLELVKAEARLKASDRLLDLYCGSGFFGLALAEQSGEVIGIEENPQSVQAAQDGAKASGIKNARFLAGDLGAVLGTLEKSPREIAVVDPPREGLLPRALDLLVGRAPQRIVYVSCYPQSLVRDLKALTAKGWKAISCTPVDMFPHTSHVEVVVTLER